MTKKKVEKRTETKENLDAFKLYCELQDKMIDDVFDRIADKFKKQRKTIYNWSSIFGWKERKKEIDDKARERALNRLAKKVENQNVRVLDKLIDNLKRAEDGVIGSIDGEYSVGDYEKLIKLFRLLTDESTENSKSEVDYSMSESDKESLLALSKSKSADIMNVKLDLGKEEEKKEIKK